MITSSPGSTAASIAAIIASVAPFETVTSLPASTSRPHAMDCLRATASRRGAAPHVVAYWLWPSRSALTAASTMRGSVSKSGNPWAKLIARSGPLSSRFCRVISRMTDSAKLSAFSDSRAADLVPRIRSLQVDVGARARKASLGPLEPALPSSAHVARPARLRKEIEHVGAAQQSDHLSAFDDRHAPDALAGHEPRGLVDPRVLGDRDHVRAHDVARDGPLFGEDVDLGDDADNESVARHHRRAGDVLARQRLRDLVDRRVFLEGDDVAGHHLFDRDHECSSSLATVPKLALPPLSSSPVRPGGSLPARYAASASHPVGSSASRRRVQATRTASPISSSDTVTIASTSRLANITSKLRWPIAVVRTPSASVLGDAGSDWMVPDFNVRYASSACSGSTPITFIAALWARPAIAVPDSRPPPPTGAASTSRSGASLSSSMAAEPWPWITSQSSNGWTSVYLFSAMTSSRRASRLAKVMPSWMTSAPSARVAATFAGLASSGMRINAGMPTVRAASATACAWLPELTAMTPRGRSW